MGYVPSGLGSIYMQTVHSMLLGLGQNVLRATAARRFKVACSESIGRSGRKMTQPLWSC